MEAERIRQKYRLVRNRGLMKAQLENKTVREMFADLDRLSIGFQEHMKLGFIPKAQSLVKLVRKLPNDLVAQDVDDLTVRINASRVLESEQFSDQLFMKIEAYSQAIEKRVQFILTGSD